MPVAKKGNKGVLEKMRENSDFLSKMSMRQYIYAYRDMIQDYLVSQKNVDYETLDYDEMAMWIMNDEFLYNQALSLGMKYKLFLFRKDDIIYFDFMAQGNASCTLFEDISIYFDEGYCEFELDIRYAKVGEKYKCLSGSPFKSKFEKDGIMTMTTIELSQDNYICKLERIDNCQICDVVTLKINDDDY